MKLISIIFGSFLSCLAPLAYADNDEVPNFAATTRRGGWDQGGIREVVPVSSACLAAWVIGVALLGGQRKCGVAASAVDISFFNHTMTTYCGAAFLLLPELEGIVTRIRCKPSVSGQR
jgi:hypothetical protein